MTRMQDIEMYTNEAVFTPLMKKYQCSATVSTMRTYTYSTVPLLCKFYGKGLSHVTQTSSDRCHQLQ